jgi:hypothetical protein
MPGTKTFLAQDLSNFFEAVWLNLPATAAKMLLGMGNENELREAGWKAYDAWESLSNEAANAFYANPLVAEFAGRMMETALRLQQMGAVMSAVFFGNLWQSFGSPTRREVAELRDELLALREELAAYTGRPPISGGAAKPEPENALESPHALRDLWKGATNGNASAMHDFQSRRRSAAY